MNFEVLVGGDLIRGGCIEAITKCIIVSISSSNCTSSSASQRSRTPIVYLLEGRLHRIHVIIQFTFASGPFLYLIVVLAFLPGVADAGNAFTSSGKR